MASSCYILRKDITGAVYSVRNNITQRVAVIAFETKKQAACYKRLINEMESRKSFNKLELEKLNIDSISISCNISALDFVYFDKDNNVTTLEACTEVSDVIRMSLEYKLHL